MMKPLLFAFIPGSTAWINLRVPKKFTSNNSLAMLIGTHSNRDDNANPALLTASWTLTYSCHNINIQSNSVVSTLVLSWAQDIFRGAEKIPRPSPTLHPFLFSSGIFFLKPRLVYMYLGPSVLHLLLVWRLMTPKMKLAVIYVFQQHLLDLITSFYEVFKIAENYCKVT